MSASTRKTDMRVAERERRRRQQEAKARLWRTIPLLVIAALALLGAGAIAYGTFVQPNVSGTNGPRLQLDREQVDFGDQHFGTTVRATFKVTNAGDGTLNLNLPKTATVVQGCWPGDVVVGQTTLQPGQSTTIYTELMMHEGMGGKHLFEIPIKTNDSTQQAKTLKILSNWIP